MTHPMPPPPLPDGIDPFNLLDTEQDRVGRFLASLDGAGWEAGTDCAGWRRREMVAHLAGGEVYNLACLDDRLADLFAEAGAAGAPPRGTPPAGGGPPPGGAAARGWLGGGGR